MSYSEAKSFAVKNLSTVSSILEFKNAWAFFDSTPEEGGDLVILKTGEKMTYSEFLMKHKPKDKPVKLK